MGCSHSGICNIIDYAKKVCNEDRVVYVIDGLHLLNPSDEVLEKAAEYMKNCNIRQVHAGHFNNQTIIIVIS